MARSRFLLRAATSLSSPVFSSVFAGIKGVLLPKSLSDDRQVERRFRVCVGQKERLRAVPRDLPPSKLLLRLRDRDLARLNLLRLRQSERDHALLHLRT